MKPATSATEIYVGENGMRWQMGRDGTTHFFQHIMNECLPQFSDTKHGLYATICSYTGVIIDRLLGTREKKRVFALQRKKRILMKSVSIPSCVRPGAKF